MVKDALNTKLYYSISEVAEITSLPSYTLRAWEKEFACLRPRRVHGKNRAYRRRDLGIILLIKRLLYEERYTVQGVRQKLRNETELVRLASEQAIAGLLAGGPGANAPEVAPVAAAGPDAPAAGAPVDRADVERTAGEGREELRGWVNRTRSELRELLARLA